MPQYTPPLRDMQFVLHELLNVTEALKATPFKVLLRKRLYSPDFIDESGGRACGMPLSSDSSSMRRRA